jgi:hypothetical protein
MCGPEPEWENGTLTFIEVDCKHFACADSVNYDPFRRPTVWEFGFEPARLKEVCEMFDWPLQPPKTTKPEPEPKVETETKMEMEVESYQKTESELPKRPSAVYGSLEATPSGQSVSAGPAEPTNLAQPSNVPELPVSAPPAVQAPVFTPSRLLPRPNGSPSLRIRPKRVVSASASVSAAASASPAVAEPATPPMPKLSEHPKSTAAPLGERNENVV